MGNKKYLNAMEGAVSLGGHRRILFAFVAAEMGVEKIVSELFNFVTRNNPDSDDATMEFGSEVISMLENLIECEIDHRYEGYSWEYHPNNRGEIRFGGMVEPER